MKKHKIGIITLAITLIATGVLILLNNFIKLNMPFVLSVLWPSIIILFGLELIISKIIFDNKGENVKTTVDGVSVTLLVITVIIISVISFAGLSYERFQIFQGNGISFIGEVSGNYAHKLDYQEDYTVKIEGKSKIQVINTFGDVEIKREDVEDIQIHAEVTLGYNDEEFAKEAIKDIVKINEDTSVIRITSQGYNYQNDRDKIGNIQASYYIKVPKGLEIDIENKFGNVTVNNNDKSVVVENEHGDVLVSGIEGNVNIINSFGQIDAEAIIGRADIENKHGNIIIKNIGSEAIIRNTHGRVEAYEIKGNVNVYNSFDNIQIGNVDGNLNIDSEFSDIRINDIKGDIDVRGNNGEIYGEKIDGNVYASNKFDEIKIKGANKSIRLYSEHGDISLEASSVIENDLEIENQFGNVLLRIPKEQEGNFNCITSFGSIYSDFDLSIKEEQNEESVTDTLGNGNVKFRITNKNGDIRLSTY